MGNLENLSDHHNDDNASTIIDTTQHSSISLSRSGNIEVISANVNSCTEIAILNTMDIANDAAAYASIIANTKLIHKNNKNTKNFSGTEKKTYHRIEKQNQEI